MSGKPAKGGAYETLIGNREFVVLDIETTTKAATKDAHETTYPISIGAVVLLNGSRRETFHQLTNPGVPVDKHSSAHNGIKTADLKEADDNATVLAEFDGFLAEHPDAIIVCHNAYFDIPHLHAAYTRAGMTPFTRQVIDSMFLPVRLRLPDAVARPKLTTLSAHYGVDTGLPGIAKPQHRLRKALVDAQNTAEVLSWMLAEAAAKGITEWSDFLAIAKPKTSDEIAAHQARRRRKVRAPSIPAKHVTAVHGKRGLPRTPTTEQLDTWVGHVRDCALLHCPNAVEKVTVEVHRPTLLDRLTPLIADCTNAGDIGTLLGVLEPLLHTLDRPGARAWYRTNHKAIKAAPACDDLRACPHCVAGQPCPKDTTYHLLTRRALDYGVTSKGEPVSLFSRQVKDDLWDTGKDRKMDTWPKQGMHDMAAYMMWMLIDEARRKRNATRAGDIRTKAIARRLHEHDPRLALEVARHWAKQPRKDDAIERLVETLRAKATTDPGYLELDMWFDGPHQKAIAAREAAKHRKAKRKAKGLRKPAEVELRPAAIQHTYRYQLHRSSA